MSAAVPPRRVPTRRVSAAAVFGALLLRDAAVARRELPAFLVRVTFQPLMFVTVFGYLMPLMNLMDRSYSSTLLPGILGVTLAFSSLQGVALPMVADLGSTREIEDRLLAPIPTWLVALQKVVAGVIQGMIAASFVLPVARLIMGSIPHLTMSHAGELLVVTFLGAATFSTLGLLLGTVVSGPQIGLLFSLIVAPMIMFGCAYYPWKLMFHVPVIQYAVLVNPLVYVSEGMRCAMTPDLPHMRLRTVVVALTVITGIFWWLGLKTFLRRSHS
jgi:ABC-2 type transport system permease protein